MMPYFCFEGTFKSSQVLLSPEIPDLVFLIQPNFGQIKHKLFRRFIAPVKVGLRRLSKIGNIE